jgi:hypothetical protein
MKKPSMKNTRKEERERSCERTSQKPDSPAPVKVSDHQHQFGDKADEGTARRRNGGAESESVFRESNES